VGLSPPPGTDAIAEAYTPIVDEKIRGLTCYSTQVWMSATEAARCEIVVVQRPLDGLEYRYGFNEMRNGINSMILIAASYGFRLSGRAHKEVSGRRNNPLDPGGELVPI
jgi:hypothetical protein